MNVLLGILKADIQFGVKSSSNIYILASYVLTLNLEFKLVDQSHILLSYVGTCNLALTLNDTSKILALYVLTFNLEFKLFGNFIF